jgi:hypothetical protein
MFSRVSSKTSIHASLDGAIAAARSALARTSRTDVSL